MFPYMNLPFWFLLIFSIIFSVFFLSFCRSFFWSVDVKIQFIFGSQKSLRPLVIIINKQKYQILVYILPCWLFWILTKNSFLKPKSKRFSPTASYISFTFTSLFFQNENIVFLYFSICYSLSSEWMVWTPLWHGKPSSALEQKAYCGVN